MGGEYTRVPAAGQFFRGRKAVATVGPGVFRKDLEALRERAEQNRALLPKR